MLGEINNLHLSGCTTHAAQNKVRAFIMNTNLSLPSCALLNHAARHRAADGETLENTSNGVTEAQSD